MSKGSYPVAWNGKVHGHEVYVEGQGWVYVPLPKDDGWVILSASETPTADHGADRGTG